MCHPLLPELPGARRMAPAARYQGKVIAQHIDRDRGKCQGHTSPEWPAMMHAFPIRTLFSGPGALAFPAFVPVAAVVNFAVTLVVTFAHMWLRLIYAADTANFVWPGDGIPNALVCSPRPADGNSIAAVYSPRRAALLHIAL